jgi:hypothetical protein
LSLAGCVATRQLHGRANRQGQARADLRTERKIEIGLTYVVPFLIEGELMRLGAIFEKQADWQPLAIVDGRRITGQNPAT